jgi:hypothetical protein
VARRVYNATIDGNRDKDSQAFLCGIAKEMRHVSPLQSPPRICSSQDPSLGSILLGSESDVPLPSINRP